MDPPADTIVLTEGDENVRINCSARGYPSPSIVFVGHSIVSFFKEESYNFELIKTLLGPPSC